MSNHTLRFRNEVHRSDQLASFKNNLWEGTREREKDNYTQQPHNWTLTEYTYCALAFVERVWLAVWR